MAFCPQCSALQIRVAVADVLPSSTLSSDRGASLPDRYFSSPLGTRIDWSRALPATALAGLIAAILMMTPLAAFWLGMVIGGCLSVFFYRRRDPVAQITPWIGTRLGMATGVLGGGILIVLLSAGTIAFRAWDRIREKIIELIQQTAARNPDPQAQQAMEFFKTPQGITLLVASALVGTLIAFVVFSGLGGALGATLLRRREHPRQ